MVIRKKIRSNALISVYDKSNLLKVCKAFTTYNIGIISTGSTAKKIKELGFKCTEISKLTKLQENLNGRIKTLHHKIYSSILYDREKLSDTETFLELNFPNIDYLIVNFYPFSKLSINNEIDMSEKIELIDIGGPSMVRAASKNFKYVTAISSTKFYSNLVSNLNKNKGTTSNQFRLKMAENNFKLTSEYDQSIYDWFSNKKNKLKKNIVTKIKYGENPNQKAYFIENHQKNIFSSQLSGGQIGYNNVLDISDGMDCLSDFKEPTCVIIKHNNPCGVASKKNIRQSFLKAMQADPMSAYGGVLLLNRKIDEGLAKHINKYFFEILVAPGFGIKALQILKSKKNLIIINSNGLQNKTNLSLRSVNSGTLHQEKNLLKISSSKLKLVSRKKSSKKILDDLVFAYKVAKHVKSNAIVLVANKQTLGIGAGQMSRLDATRIAILKYKDFFKNKNFVCASDAFFPFIDNLELLKSQKCRAVIQPPGSKNDFKIINYAIEKKLSLYFIKNRVFKH